MVVDSASLRHVRAGGLREGFVIARRHLTYRGLFPDVLTDGKRRRSLDSDGERAAPLISMDS
jgi:hypothetical protein